MNSARTRVAGDGEVSWGEGSAGHEDPAYLPGWMLGVAASMVPGAVTVMLGRSALEAVTVVALTALVVAASVFLLPSR
ncbi:hypothetical protein C8K36_101277 [Rhodococcus sp. OK519]|uniref:hypothetical protein n=1 Tax=Rhodococcus sp. OK519 TaxID=2135729 RepID=UPI000D3CC484|nr:hypothetical protein C8K36_101277 [Rhodococcus sp. OK519]